MPSSHFPSKGKQGKPLVDFGPVGKHHRMVAHWDEIIVAIRQLLMRIPGNGPQSYNINEDHIHQHLEKLFHIWLLINLQHLDSNFLIPKSTLIDICKASPTYSITYNLNSFQNQALRIKPSCSWQSDQCFDMVALECQVNSHIQALLWWVQVNKMLNVSKEAHTAWRRFRRSCVGGPCRLTHCLYWVSSVTITVNWAYNWMASKQSNCSKMVLKCNSGHDSS